MKSLFIRAALAAFLGLSALAPAAAQDLANPSGHWVSAGGEARYKVEMCGDGTLLCVKLVWLRADMRTPENLAYLNRYVIQGARPTDFNQWRGAVHYNGEDVRGSITMVSDNNLQVNGCRLIVCQTVDFVRV